MQRSVQLLRPTNSWGRSGWGQSAEFKFCSDSHGQGVCAPCTVTTHCSKAPQFSEEMEVRILCRARKRQVRSTYIKESLVTRVLRGPHAGARRDDHFHFSQINVALTAGVLTRVIVSQLEPKGAD